jgi:mono/diheme cytochrome c family protein
MNSKANIKGMWILLLLSGCTQKMAMHGHLKTFGPSPLKNENSLVRSEPDFTQAWPKDAPTLKLSAYENLVQGQKYFQIYCSVCHGASGYGNGMIVTRGFLAPPSYHSERLRNAPDAHFYDVITHGYGAMYSYGDRLSPDERWQVVSYIRALQLSQNMKLQDLTPEEKTTWEKSP